MNADDTVTQFLAAICRFDFDGACALVRDDVEYDNVPMGKNFGPEGIRALLEPMMSGFDEVDWVVHRQVAQGTFVMNERTDRFRRGDRWMEIPVAAVFVVEEDGLISLWRDYFDMATMGEQLKAVTED